MIKVYTASKLDEAPFWRELSLEWPEVEFTARWTWLHLEDRPEPESTYGKLFWQHDIEDVKRADVVLVFGRPGQHLRGALVEAGAGIAFGKRVIVVGTHPDYGTWQFHPQVFPVRDFTQARLLLRKMAGVL